MSVVAGLFGVSVSAAADDDDPHLTGLPEFTAKELALQNQHHLRVRNVKFNSLGIKRVDAHRRAKGLKEQGFGEVAAVGSEVEGAPAAVDPSPVAFSGPGAAVLPTYVDNSTLKYFPPIRSQSPLNSCGSFAGTYYAMTHMLAMARDLDAKAGGDSLRLSPKWTYNMLNEGANTGSWYYDGYEIAIRHGCATWAQFPYDADFKAWCLNTAVWRDSIGRRFAQFGYVDATDLESGIQQVKQMLVNGYVLNIATYIYSWQSQPIANDPSTTEDDAFAGKSCCYWVNGSSGYHAMTVVGYNDSIWVDVNANGVVDTGEKGAFRIANSWGAAWGEAGFTWMSYDALKAVSAVAGAPSAGRQMGWYPNRAHWVTARAGYTPKLLAEFTLNHLKRNQVYLTLGTGIVGAESLSEAWYPAMFVFQGGSLAFDGTATARDGTFVFDFSELTPPSGAAKRYFLGAHDGVTGDPLTVKAFKVIDPATGGGAASAIVPLSCDNRQGFAYADYTYTDGSLPPSNVPPVAALSATPVSGTAPLVVTLSGTASTDPDGQIVSYSWVFGDGSTGSGATVSHTYASAGTYSATLTVTDDAGASSSRSVTITVSPPSNLATKLHVGAIVLTTNRGMSGTQVTAKVTVVDGLGTPVASAQVSGSWSGVVVGNVGATTTSSGVATLNSSRTKRSGTATFTVRSIIKSGCTYDAAHNVATSATISVN